MAKTRKPKAIKVETVDLEAVPIGRLAGDETAKGNLHKHGIVIAATDAKRVLAHNYGGTWQYLGPPVKPRPRRRVKARKRSSRR